MARAYRILRVRDHTEGVTELVVTAQAIDDPDVNDVINRFPSTPAGLTAAREYVRSVQAIQDSIDREERQR